MKIAYISYESSNDLNAWSGTISAMAKYLSKENEVIRIDKLSRPIDLYYKVLSYINHIFGYTQDFRRNKSYVRLVTERIQKRLDSLDYDLIFAPGSTYITYIKSDKPIVVWADATFMSLINSYPQYSKLTKKQLREGDELENIAFNNCAKVIFSTTWAANSAIEDYNIASSNIEIIPFGANLNHKNSEDVICEFIKSKPTDRIYILFVGKVWEKKGGEQLLEIFAELRKLSENYYLDVVGSSPSPIPEIDGITFHGFLDKSDSAQNEKLISLYKKAHYFLLPTKAEAFGIVFCEANSYGLPTFGSNLGGIPDIIKNGINGELIDIEKSPKELALQIHKYISKGDYKEKSLRAFQHYQDNFTWDKSIEKVNKVLQELI